MHNAAAPARCEINWLQYFCITRNATSREFYEFKIPRERCYFQATTIYVHSELIERIAIKNFLLINSFPYITFITFLTSFPRNVKYAYISRDFIFADAPQETRQSLSA